MTYDFSYVNQYLMQARDLSGAAAVATLLGIPVDMARLLAELNSRDLAHISHISRRSSSHARSRGGGRGC